MKKLKRRILVYGLVTVLAFGNAIVTIANERHKSLLISNNVEAQAYIPPTIPLWLLYLILNDINNGGNGGTYYKYLERNNLSCAEVTFFNGQYAKGSEAARMLDAHLGITGEAGYASGTISGNVSTNYSASKSVASNYYYEYNITIRPTGNNWKFKSCEPCSSSDPDNIGTSCTPFDECAQYIESQGSAYRAALGLS